MIIYGNDMNFTEFKHQFQGSQIILSRDVVQMAKNPQAMRNQLSRWQKKGLLIGLRQGVYMLGLQDRKADVDKQVVANRLYEPSYLSLEYALNFYGLIPEQVVDLTSITTRKTMRFENKLGHFVYQHIQPKAFRGFRKMGNEKSSYFMAEPEKAVADFLYLNLSQFTKNVKEILEHSFRFQNIEELNKKRLMELGKLFGSKKLMRVLKLLGQWIEEEQND